MMGAKASSKGAVPSCIVPVAGYLGAPRKRSHRAAASMKEGDFIPNPPSFFKASVATLPFSATFRHHGMIPAVPRASPAPRPAAGETTAGDVVAALAAAVPPRAAAGWPTSHVSPVSPTVATDPPPCLRRRARLPRLACLHDSGGRRSRATPITPPSVATPAPPVASPPPWQTRPSPERLPARPLTRGAPGQRRHPRPPPPPSRPPPPPPP
ncbi:hypothetical protein I4F81_001733 [Pyropia yezoensis]|uniref:Uncharacterized protein n=1 Tax=Pyropia yezoensis TaxID=2788 RepID=A0ACC3BN12_PYRYE|nr:hypothetical protein I4F81_001733 [Neopyropia yezoensis]